MLVAGRTHLRLRLASHPLAPELPLGVTRVLTQGLPTLALLAAATVLTLVFGIWLDSDPDTFVRALGSVAVSALTAALGWAGLWTLLSKVFTRQSHFGWHLRVLLIAVLTWQALTVATSLLAFALSWPGLTDFGFVLDFAILSGMLYFHLQAVEPHHPRRTLGLAVASVVLGVGVSVWRNVQSSDRLGEELYMNHLFPPALRVAKPVDTTQFLQGVAALQATLDDKARDDVKD